MRMYMIILSYIMPKLLMLRKETSRNEIAENILILGNKDLIVRCEYGP